MGDLLIVPDDPDEEKSEKERRFALAKKIAKDQAAFRMQRTSSPPKPRELTPKEKDFYNVVLATGLSPDEAQIALRLHAFPDRVFVAMGPWGLKLFDTSVANRADFLVTCEVDYLVEQWKKRGAQGFVKWLRGKKKEAGQKLRRLEERANAKRAAREKRRQRIGKAGSALKSLGKGLLKPLGAVRRFVRRRGK